MSLRILQPGTFSLLVDQGRPCTRHLGLPLGGASDRGAFALGNALVGNSLDSIALEITLSGPVLEAENDVSACVFGAPFSIHVSGQTHEAGKVFQIRRGEKLAIGGANRGARGYLCVQGGFQNTLTAEATRLAEGTLLQCRASYGAGRSLESDESAVLIDPDAPPDTLRIVDGPQADWYPGSKFLEQTFTVTPSSNRMGVRLDGKPLVRQPREMISEAVAPGAIQVTNEGLPIILGVDGQTIGGYPKIAHVIRADLDRIAQLRPGRTLQFRRVTLAEAETLAQNRHLALQRWLTRLRIFVN